MSVSRLDAVSLLALAALWGGSFLFIRVAAPAFGPLPLMAGRVVLAGLALWAVLAVARGARGRRALAAELRAAAGRLAVLGALNAAVPFTLIAAAELRLGAALPSVLNATVPLFAALAGAAWLREPVGVRRLAGLGLGVGGVAVLVGWTPDALAPASLAAVGASLLASACYGVSAVYTRRRLAGVPAAALALGQQVAAAAWLAPAALWVVWRHGWRLPAGPVGGVPAPAVWALVGLAVLSTAVAYLLYFRLVARLGPVRANTVTYLVPLFGVTWGAAALGEPVTSAMLAGLGLVLASVALVHGGPAAPPAAPPTVPGARRAAARAALVAIGLAGAVVPGAAGAQHGAPPAEGGAYDGRRGQLDVRPPRVDGPDADTRVDGVLDEPVWRRAARLTGFSRFQPSDGAPATDSTEVLVWHSPTAIHFGVRASAPPGTVNATLGDRDRVLADDHVTLLLSTFDDARQAVAFAVNPLGVQMDGTLVETGAAAAAGGFASNGGAAAREAVDLSADFVFQSRGRVTPWGYEVEVRIPFKTLRYQSAPVQRWGVHVLRRVQRLGVEDSWVPARRGAASFLAQGGRLSGLAGLRRGLVLDLTPSLTQRTAGAPAAPGAAPAGWRYRASRPEPGGTVRWGVTNNLTLNGTVRPDFSQVEADVAQVQVDPRQALFFPERRPFFLDGIEQFSVPNGLIYTRRIVQPSAAAKLSGKVAGTDVAVLAAVDDPGAGPEVRGAARHPVYAVARVQRDLGAQSRAGVVVTSRDSGGASNRVAGLDARLVFGGVYTAAAQLAGSATRDPARATRAGPLVQAALDRTGRRFGFRYAFYGVGEDFVAGAGFIPRPGVTRAAVTHRLTVFPGARSPFLSLGGSVFVDGTWKSRAFAAGGRPLEEKLHLNANAQLRGGWTAGASLLLERYRYDPELYADHYVARPATAAAPADTVPYVGTPVLPNRDWVLSLNTPQYRRLSANVLAIWGRDENFYEWQSADILFVDGGLTVRPTGRLRLDGTYALRRFARPSDGSVVGVRQIPRLRVEYQVARPVFVRLVGQYVAARQDSLRDDGRTNGAVFRRAADGTFARLGARRANTFRGDALFSYQPTPGTVFFAGYGETMTEPDALRFRGLARTADGFFVKASYLFRL